MPAAVHAISAADVALRTARLSAGVWEITGMQSHPVLEVAILSIKQGQVVPFLDAFSVAEPIIIAAEGYGGHELRRCAENDHRFLLLVWWDSVQSHEIGFRQSAAYAQWRRLLHRFYDPFPVVEHYLPERGRPAHAQ